MTNTSLGLLSEEPYKSIFSAVNSVASNSGATVYLVGGAVRDLLTGKKSQDMDFVVFDIDYTEFATQLARYLKTRTVPFKDNIRIPYRKGKYIDISTPRGRTLPEDLALRDFTVNNLALSMDGKIIGNPADVYKKIIVPVNLCIFEDDPLRILRGFRQAAALDYTLSKEFLRLAGENVHLLKTVAPERICEELKKISHANYITEEIYRSMTHLGLFELIFGIRPRISLLTAISLLKKMDGTKPNSDEKFAVFLATALHDNPDRAKGVLKDLKTSNQISKLTLRLLEESPAVRAAAGQSCSEMQKTAWHSRDIASLLLAYSGLIYDIKKERMTDYQKIWDILAAPYPRLTGNDIAEQVALEQVQTEPGKWIAQLLEDINFRLAFGLLCGMEEARMYAREKVRNLWKNR